MAKAENIEKAGSTFIGLVDHFKENWIWWILVALFSFMVAIMFTFVKIINSDKMFKRYDEYVEMKHQCSNDYRIETAPVITSYLNNLATETNTDESFVLEFHNGKSNPSGLQWQYVDMTFICDDCEDVRDEFQNVSGVRYPLSYKIHDDTFFIGTRADVDKIDHRLALRLEANGIEYVGFVTMYGRNATELGMVGVAYNEKPNINKDDIKKVLMRYAIKIAPYLDVTNAEQKKK